MIEDRNIPAIIRKAEDKLESSKIIFKSGHFDDASSRAYYAVFHAITAALFAKGLTFSTHSKTIGAFNKEFIKDGIFPKEFSGMIQELFVDRQIGDYEIRSWIESETAEENIRTAEIIVTTIKKYLQSIDAL